jgi:hypothetical protein
VTALDTASLVASGACAGTADPVCPAVGGSIAGALGATAAAAAGACGGFSFGIINRRMASWSIAVGFPA